jgi:regulator of RNase E activity RraA
MSVTHSRHPGHPATPEEIALFERIEKELYSAVISDALDSLGFYDQAMREFIRPLNAGFRCAGFARTIACADMHYVPANPYEIELEAIDSLLKGEVAVVATQQSIRNAPWGELLSTASRARGARGAIVEGLVRDVQKIEELGFPVFATGIKPVDSKGRGIVTDYNVPVQCGGVVVYPGDLVFADYDGVVVIPAKVIEQTLEIATDKVHKENHTRDELMQGAYLRDVYAKYGVL